MQKTVRAFSCSFNHVWFIVHLQYITYKFELRVMCSQNMKGTRGRDAVTFRSFVYFLRAAHGGTWKTKGMR